MIAPQDQRGHLNLAKRGHYDLARSHKFGIIDIGEAKNACSNNEHPIFLFFPAVHPLIQTRRRTNCRLAITAFALCLACASEAKEFTWEFTRNGGKATQTFDGIGPLFTYFVTPTAYQPELLGEVTLDTLSILVPGRGIEGQAFTL